MPGGQSAPVFRPHLALPCPSETSNLFRPSGTRPFKGMMWRENPDGIVPRQQRHQGPLGPHLPECPWPQACPRGATRSILHPSSWLWADADKPPVLSHAHGSRFPRGQAPWSLISAVIANHTHLELRACKLFTYLFIQQTFVRQICPVAAHSQAEEFTPVA